MKRIGMWDLIIESAVWNLGPFVLRLELTETRHGVRFVAVHHHYPEDEFPTRWGQLEPFGADEHRQSLARFEGMLHGFTDRHGDPTERGQMIDPRYRADMDAVLREMRFAGLEISESDVLPCPETGTLTIHGMLWWDWLAGMASE
ncbi:hypothetical protein AB0E21_05080 [Streptomyces sp. NPDC047967]|uniref:hypothetical protein n=1 Tax=Streptomyces sp. NPDC047967 TaxID=3154924 RepID=UPI0033FE0255